LLSSYFIPWNLKFLVHRYLDEVFQGPWGWKEIQLDAVTGSPHITQYHFLSIGIASSSQK
jgi:hypothetical protein